MDSNMFDDLKDTEEKDNKKPRITAKPVTKTDPPKESDIESLQRELAEVKAKLEMVRSRGNADFHEFEDHVRSLMERKQEICVALADAPKTLLTKERKHRGPNGEVLRYLEHDFTSWTPEQRELREEYYRIEAELEKLMSRTVKVTLKNNPNVHSEGLTVGYNGLVGTIYNSDSKNKRIQLVPYGMYLTAVQSHFIQFTTAPSIPSPNGDGLDSPRVEAVRVHPVIEVGLAD